jgi:hypothetical protein
LLFRREIAVATTHDDVLAIGDMCVVESLFQLG